MSSKLPAAGKATRQFRILALPLARLPRPPPPSRTLPTTPPPSLESASSPQTTPPTPLILFHAVQPEPSANSSPSLITKALDKSSETWLKLGEKPKGSWMYWFYEKGEKLMDRIEYEEWALKAVREGEGVKVAKDGKVLERIEIPLVLPRLPNQEMPTLLPKLHRFLLKRIPHHRKMMYRSILFSPVTWPFAIIPIIPNFPLFYVLWRAWSHYKAWRGATYLEQLIKAGLVVEKECPELTEIYAGKGREPLTATAAVTDKSGKIAVGTTDQPFPPPAPGPITSQAQHPSLLLSPSQIPLLAKTFALKANEVVDVTRAVEQADFRARKADQVEAKEAQEKKKEREEKEREKKE
ncbi:hypothetical protein C360_02625 [Cryptococcus neoformans Bt15]|nr:hypothetical protein C360_02625 [Cryptococcus neoformans var. grubii Bt15]